MEAIGILICASFAVAASTAHSKADIPCDCHGCSVIVVPDEATAVEKFAASELAGELGKCLGDVPEILIESQLTTPNSQLSTLYVGATKAAKAARGEKPWQTDEVFLKSVPNGVVLDGDPARAPIYAVDLYLEKYCGVRWWTSDAATYPRLSAAPLKDIDLEYAPQFKYRETYYLDGFDPLFKVRSKGNFTSITRFLLDEIKFIPPEMGGNHRLYFFKGRHSAYHSFFEILPPKVYFEKHPEWYSLVDGQRVVKQLCLANDEMKAEYIKETLRRLRDDPSVDFIQVSQNDTGGYCQCEKCKAMMDEDGGVPSGPYLRFANDVAEAVEKEFPSVRIDTFAYQFTRKAPTKTRPRHNVVVRVCDIECDFARPLTNPLPPREANFAKDLADWRRVAGGNLFLWDYLANFRGYMLPHPNIHVMAPNIRLFAENGAVGVFEQGDALCSAGSFATLRHYVVSHLLWNPADDEKQLIDEFLVGYYGASAAPILKKYIELVDNAPLKTKSVVKCYHKGVPFMSAGDKLEAARLMDEAVAAAEKEGEAFASRVRRERLSVDHYMLLNYDILKRIAAKKGYAWTRPAPRAEAVENWIRDVKAAGVKARRETTSGNEIEKYFESLRKENPDSKKRDIASAADFCDGWRFRREGGEWQTVSIPHDDAIRHDFDPKKYDTGCGALPCFGKAEYEKRFSVSPDEWRRLASGEESWRLEFDGVMSGAAVEVNGKTACARPWGYASFIVPLDKFLKEGENVVRVFIDAKERSSRWYTGFGIYRDARLVKKPADHVVPGSVAIWTESVTADAAKVRATWEMSKGGKREKSFIVDKPALWSPETPHLYTVELGGEKFRYGIRTLRFDKDKGFFLNGRHRQMRGVCLHHDLGVFGAEFEPEAARRQLSLLKEMGCDAIRTSHNFPAPGLLDLCDEMGFMVMDESFDEWSTPKVRNGMAKLWNEWHEREISDFVRRDRNHPCVVMWSAGNELAEDTKPALAALGAATGRELTALFHANDPEGRPVTAGHWKPQTITNGIAVATDVYGANYQPQRYAEFKGRQMIVGTETCSVVSSRGVYAFPIDDKRAVTNQVPSWDLCPMHPNDYIPDIEFAAQDANPHVFGEFVWTGFDYIGEPDPWRGKARSSYFGIFDLCGFPKDRYWLYKAKWRPDEPTAHILPHWNWKVDMKIPVHVYASGDEAELFVNGVSHGRKRKGRGEYRFVWNDVPFAPGEVSVKTWRNGVPWAEDRRVTAGAFHHLEWTDKSWGEKFVFRTVRAVDEAGVLVPDAAVEVDLPPPDGCKVFGTCNGDAAELQSLRSPKVKTFSGMALVVYN